MTREEKLVSFGEPIKIPGIKKASVFADEACNRARILIDHPHAGRDWTITGPAGNQRRKLTTEAPTGFLPRRWAKYVTARDKGEPPTVARPYYELALLTTLNERLKSGDVTVTHSRRWTDFEDYLIPRATWAKEREQHYAKLGLPLQGQQYLVQLQAQLAAVNGAFISLRHASGLIPAAIRRSTPL